MTNVKLSQIAPSPSNVAATTQFVAVESGNTDYLFSPAQFVNGFQLARLNIADQILSGGWNVQSHQYTTGSITIDCGLGPAQYVSNNGAFTINAPGSDGTTILSVTNTASAGLITFSGFPSNPDPGDPLTTTNGSIFSIQIWRINGVSSYYVIAQQGGSVNAQAYNTVLASTYATSTGFSGRGNSTRWSDVINVLDYGADPTSVADSTAAIQAAVNAFAAGGNAGQRGKIYFPPGAYRVTSTINLPQTNLAGSSASIIIDGAGTVTGTGGNAGIAGITGSPAFNGFVFDDASVGNRLSQNPWSISNIQIKNPYVPPLIYKKGSLAASAAWARGASSIDVITSTIPAAGIQAGAIVCSATTFSVGGVPGYVGFVTTVTNNGLTTNLALGDTIGLGGAQIPSGGAADSLTVVQGFRANGAFTTSSTAITMAVSNPGLDAGYYYVWDFSKVTAGKNPIAQCLGVTTSAAWVGTTLTLTAASNQTSDGRTNDILVLSPISGCIRHVSTQNGVIENCVLSGVLDIALDVTNVLDPTATGSISTLEQTVRNCICNNGSLPTGSASIGQHGIFGGQSTIVENCDVNSCWVGVRMTGSNCIITGGRAEICAYGFVLGGIVRNIAANVNNAAAACLIEATETEGTWCAAVLQDALGSANQCTLDSLLITAGHSNACYGLYLPGSTATVVKNCTFNAVATTGGWGGYFNPSFAGTGSPAGIYIGNAANPQYMTFISTIASVSNGTNNFLAANSLQTGPAWRMPTTPNAARFINCNNPPAIYTFASLPIATTATGQISADGTGTGTTGNVIKFTTTVFAPIGALITGSGITAGTFITSSNINSTVAGSVNNTPVSAVPPGTTITIYPIVDGDEYLISDCLVTSAGNFGAQVTVGGGSNHVKLRWNSGIPGWIIV